MRKGVGVGLVLLMFVFVSVSFVSANAFSDFWNKISGKTITVPDFNETCIPDGGIDDTLYLTDCCSGIAVRGSTLCEDQSDWFTDWESCTQICDDSNGTGSRSPCPYGPTGTYLCPCPEGTTNDGKYGIDFCVVSNATTTSTNQTNISCTDASVCFPVSNTTENNQTNNTNPSLNKTENNQTNESTILIAPVVEPQILGENSSCIGCLVDNFCYPFAYRTNGTFCSKDYVFVSQFTEESQCKNNFECGSNICVNNQCISVSLFQAFLNWIKNIF